MQRFYDMKILRSYDQHRAYMLTYIIGQNYHQLGLLKLMHTIKTFKKTTDNIKATITIRILVSPMQL